VTTRGSGISARVPGAGLAVATAFAMIAYQVGAKATRDALFLSSFPVASLPAMTIAAAVFSVAMAFVAARILSAYGPERVIPLGFLTSAALLVGEWAMVGPWPRGAAVAVYLHYAGLGALLISGFWAFLNERFDPRTAKRAIGRVAAGGTVGGLLGGVLAERIGSMSSVGTMLPVLALLHLACALLIGRLRDAAPPLADHEPETDSRDVVETPRSAGTARASGLRVLAGSGYLRTLVALVLLVTMSEGLIDWVFKARAAASMVGGHELLRLFAAFYTGVSLLTVVVQAGLSRIALERMGLARSVATLPAVVGVGSVGALLWPGLPSALALRAGESVLGNSLYRAGYEAFFTPVSPRDKRAVKTIVDVGAARAGDFLGAGLVQTVLLAAGLGRAPFSILLLAIAVSGAAIARSTVPPWTSWARRAPITRRPAVQDPRPSRASRTRWRRARRPWLPGDGTRSGARSPRDRCRRPWCRRRSRSWRGTRRRGKRSPRSAGPGRTPSRRWPKRSSIARATSRCAGASPWYSARSPTRRRSTHSCVRWRTGGSRSATAAAAR
jgi:ATP/ADP translocase